VRLPAPKQRRLRHPRGRRLRREPLLLNILSLVLTIGEDFACSWLQAILLAQMFGWYNTSFRHSNRWGLIGTGAGAGAAVDFALHSYYRQDFQLRPFWVADAVLGSVPPLGVLYAAA
jgi:hypothetical protein